MARVETVKVKDGDYFKTINVSDFQEGIHERYTAQDPPRDYLSLSELRRLLEQVNDAEAVDALEAKENDRPDGPRKGAVKAIEDRRATLETNEGGDSEGE